MSICQNMVPATRDDSWVRPSVRVPRYALLGVDADPWMGQRGGRRRTSSSSSPSASISASTP